jgi:glycosyltransferase involved in cell wall biosynthesis
VDVSVVIPVYNEVESIPLLHRQVTAALNNAGRSYEILFVDDGSHDGSFEQLAELARQDRALRVLRLRRNFGQTAALQAGIQAAIGDVIVTMDGDLQNDPSDIPLLLAKIDEGYDLVHGWRKNRQDRWLDRRLPSLIANKLISRVTRFPIHDLGCTLKAIRREIAQDLELYGEMHRFIPILAFARGARCVEMVTRHHPRRFGTTKYGISRTLRVILDLMTVKYLLDYYASPMRLFGMIGLATSAAAMASLLGTVCMKWFQGVDMTGNPLLLLTALLTMAAIQFFSLGLIGEVNARTYFGRQEKQPFTIREQLNDPAQLDTPSPSHQQRAA